MVTRSTFVAMLLFSVAFTATGQSQPDSVIIPGESIPGGQCGVAVARHGRDVFVGNSELAGFGVATGVVGTGEHRSGDNELHGYTQSDSTPKEPSDDGSAP